METGIKVIGNFSYAPKHCIGQGSYGKVFEGQDRRTNTKVAIKQMDIRYFERDAYLKSQLFTEIEILKKLNHVNIVKLNDVLQTTNSFYMITEFCKEGDLRNYLSKKRSLTESEALKIFGQIVEGFKELCKNGIIHRDLKPANILLSNGVYKIADFGFARFVDNFNGAMLNSCVGSPLYMAPQILGRKHYSTKCDVWSLGCILYEMIFGDTPWKGTDEKDLLKNILTQKLNFNKKITVRITKKCEEVLAKTLTKEERDRANWEELSKSLGGTSNNNGLPDPLKPKKSTVYGQRHELAFRHFICIELSLNSSLIKSLLSKSPDPLILEKLLFTLSQIILSNAKSTLSEQISSKENSEGPENLKILEKETGFYKKFLEDLVTDCRSSGLWDNLKREKDIEGLLPETGMTFCDRKREQAFAILKSSAIDIVKEVMNEISKRKLEEDQKRDALVCCDYILDLISSFKSSKSLSDPQTHYESKHKEKSISDSSGYFEKVKTKMQMI